jgi:hypothetical protein
MDAVLVSVAPSGLLLVFVESAQGCAFGCTLGYHPTALRACQIPALAP